MYATERSSIKVSRRQRPKLSRRRSTNLSIFSSWSSSSSSSRQPTTCGMKLPGFLLIGLTAIIIAVDGSVGSSLSTSASVGSSMSTTISSTVMTPTTASIDDSGEWLYPSLCNSSFSCIYTASWSLDPEQDVITFTIVAKQPTDTWTAIGIAPHRSMETVDVVFGYINSQGQGVVYDGWIGSRWTRPTVDAQQNLLNSSITYQDGYLTLKFSRYRQSPDQQSDYSFSDTSCYYFLFPVGGGHYNDDAGISEHFYSPDVSSDQICIINTGSVDSSMSTSGSVGSSTSTSGSVGSSTSTSGSTGR